MTNQLNFSAQNTILNSGKLWLFCKILLAILFACTILSSLNLTTSSILIFNLAIGVILISLSILMKFQSNQYNYIKIENEKLQYFCPIKKEIITIDRNDITEVRSHFCELEIHTNSKTFFFNLEHIKHEKQRWEVKEMIKNLVIITEKRAANF